MINCFAVLGNPIAHSLSPFIHQQFAEQTGLQLSYEKILVPEVNFEQVVSDFFRQGGKGLNITLPFKQRAFLMAEVPTPRCKEVKSANTLWFYDGKLYADNTDGIGLIRDLMSCCELVRKDVLVLGAGGAARGIIGPLLAAPIAELVLVNRTKEKAIELQTDFPQIKINCLSELKAEYDLIINATSASLAQDAMDLPPSLLKPTTLCYDLSYSTKGTPFVQWAVKQGVQGMDGLGMLVEQAAEAFYIWHGVRPETGTILHKLKSLVQGKGTVNG